MKIKNLKLILLISWISLGIIGIGSGAGASALTPAQILIEKSGRNLSDGTNWATDLIAADPNELLEFAIRITAPNGSLTNLTLQDSLPAGLIYRGGLKIDNVSVPGEITIGFKIDKLSSGQSKVVTFRAQAAAAQQFAFGQNELINSALVYGAAASASDTVKIMVKRTAIVGAATVVPTGLTNNLLLDSFVLPLVIAASTVWLLRSQIIDLEEWLDGKKKKARAYKAEKLLQFKIAQIRAQGEEFDP